MGEIVTAVKRGPRKLPPALDQAHKGAGDAQRWIDGAATFLTVLESRVLMGEASLPIDLCKELHDLLRQP